VDETGKIFLFSFFYENLILYKDSEEDESSPSKKKSSTAPVVVSNRPQRACKQKPINYHV